jgi:hypothetical protein
MTRKEECETCVNKLELIIRDKAVDITTNYIPDWQYIITLAQDAINYLEEIKSIESNKVNPQARYRNNCD